MTENNRNIAYLVRGQEYKLLPLNIFLDGILGAGQGFRNNSLYNQRRLVVPGRFVMGEFEENMNSGELILKDDIFFIDRTPATLRKYEEKIRKGILEPERQWYLTDESLRAIVNQATNYVLSLRRENPIQDKMKLLVDGQLILNQYSN